MPYGLGMAELPFPAPPLADDVVLLRPWRESDVPAKLMAFSDPVVQRFSWSRSTPYTGADARSHFVEQQAARLLGEELNFALVEPTDDDIVRGGGSLYDVDLEQGRAAVGYWLAGEARGRGVATHAVRLVALPVQGRPARHRRLQPAARRASVAASELSQATLGASAERSGPENPGHHLRISSLERRGFVAYIAENL